MFPNTLRANPQLPDGLCALQDGHPCPLQRFRRRIEMGWARDLNFYS